MKKHNTFTLLIGGILLVIFLTLLFCFQVRTTEVAVVTRFGRYARVETEPGLNFRWPNPIEKVFKFDKRLQNFQYAKLEQTFTLDKKSPVVSLFVGWRIADPKTYFERFGEDPMKADSTLEGIVRDAKNSIIGRYKFTDLVSPDPAQVKFDDIERDMLAYMQKTASNVYGISIELVGIKQLGLPESITAKVFDRMKAERESKVRKFISEGTSRATTIKSEADRKRDEILSEAKGQERIILGGAEARAAEAYQILNSDPEFASFQFSLRALETSLKDRTTIIADEKTPPFNLLKGESGLGAPAARPSGNK